MTIDKIKRLCPSLSLLTTTNEESIFRVKNVKYRLETEEIKENSYTVFDCLNRDIFEGNIRRYKAIPIAGQSGSETMTFNSPKEFANWFNRHLKS